MDAERVWHDMLSLALICVRTTSTVARSAYRQCQLYKQHRILSIVIPNDSVVIAPSALKALQPMHGSRINPCSKKQGCMYHGPERAW